MQRKYLFNALILLNAINMTRPLPTKANQEEPLPLSSPPPIELTEPVLTVPNIAVKIVGTAKEQAELEPVQAIVKNILNNSKLGVVKLPVSDGGSITPAMKVAQHLEIVISAKALLESPRSYQVSISLQEKGLQNTAKLFDYFLDDPDKLYQNLKNYLTEYLNLQPKATTAQVVTAQSAQSQSAAQDKSYPVAPLLTPSPPEQLATNQPSVSSLPANQKPGTVLPQQEIQLKNMSPAIKHIAIKLQGTEREKEELEEVQMMVNDILNSSKLEVVRIPVSNEPITTPAIKVYENLEIVIDIKSPTQVDQAYQVSITLQEQGSPGEIRVFKYYPHDNQKFFNELKAYLTEHLNLQPQSSG
jgi:hypothetical protein